MILRKLKSLFGKDPDQIPRNSDLGQAAYWDIKPLKSLLEKLGVSSKGVTFKQEGEGAVERSAQDKLEEVVSVKDYGAIGDGVTNDQVAIELAVEKAIQEGKSLYWPSGTYVSTSSIPYFHNVSHIGDGVIKRGVDLFYIGGSLNNVNTLYVSNNGLSSNDGLSSDHPVFKIQEAIDFLPKYGPVLKGVWRIQLAPGVYDRGRFPDEGLMSGRPIEIVGPDVGGHPNVPVAIISEGDNGVSAEGVRIRRGTKVKCKDIHFIGFNGTTSSAGISSGGFCEIYTVNCHFTNCTWGVSGSELSFVDMKGGVLEGCGYRPDGSVYSSGGGVRGLFLTKFSIGSQNAGNLNNGPFFKNNNFGVFAQEHIDGHLDWCVIEGNRVGVRLNICSRLNMGGSSFTRNSTAVWAEGNSVASLFSSNYFGEGNDANSINVICNSGGTVDPSSFFLQHTGKSTTERGVFRDILEQEIKSTTNVEFFSTTLLKQMWNDARSHTSGLKKLRFKVYGTLSGNAGTKTIFPTFGGRTAPINFTASETGHFEGEGSIIIGPSSVGKQYMSFSAYRNLGTYSRVINNFANADLSNDVKFALAARVENASDTITINACEVWVDGL